MGMWNDLAHNWTCSIWNVWYNLRCQQKNLLYKYFDSFFLNANSQ